VPALAAGLQRNATQPGGLESLLAALGSGQHARYVDDPTSLARPDAISDGNAILGHILGSKDVSRSVATRAAGQTGLDPSLLKRLLPLAATLVMGAMAKNQGTAGPARNPAAAGGGLLGMLTPLLDQNRDGSVVDDVIGQAGRFFGGR
jgi:hypothetical protein